MVHEFQPRLPFGSIMLVYNRKFCQILELRNASALTQQVRANHRIVRDIEQGCCVYARPKSIAPHNGNLGYQLIRNRYPRAMLQNEIDIGVVFLECPHPRQ